MKKKTILILLLITFLQKNICSSYFDKITFSNSEEAIKQLRSIDKKTRLFIYDIIKNLSIEKNNYDFKKPFLKSFFHELGHDLAVRLSVKNNHYIINQDKSNIIILPNGNGENFAVIHEKKEKNFFLENSISEKIYMQGFVAIAGFLAESICYETIEQKKNMLEMYESLDGFEKNPSVLEGDIKHFFDSCNTLAQRISKLYNSNNDEEKNQYIAVNILPLYQEQAQKFIILFLIYQNKIIQLYEETMKNLTQENFSVCIQGEFWDQLPHDFFKEIFNQINNLKDSAFSYSELSENLYGNKIYKSSVGKDNLLQPFNNETNSYMFFSPNQTPCKNKITPQEKETTNQSNDNFLKQILGENYFAEMQQYAKKYIDENELSIQQKEFKTDKKRKGKELKGIDEHSTYKKTKYNKTKYNEEEKENLQIN